MHCFYQFLLMSSIFTRILSLAHLFYAYFTHGPNKSASAQYDNTRGAWLTQEGCTLTERKEARGFHAWKYIPIYSHHNIYKFSFLLRTIIDWNSLSPHSVDSPSIDTFRARNQNHQGFYAWTLTTTVVSDYTQTPRLLANNAMRVRRQLKVTDNSRD